MDVRVVIVLLVMLLVVGMVTILVKLRVAKERRLKNLVVVMKEMLPTKLYLKLKSCTLSSHLHLKRGGRVKFMDRNIYLLRLLQRMAR